MTGLSAWVGCWRCYNEGHLIGYWIDLGRAEPTTAAVHHRQHRMSEGFDASEHEELGVFDLDGDLALLTNEIGESLHAAMQVTEALAEVEPSRIAAFAAYAAAADETVDTALVKQFQEQCVGAYESVRDFGMEYCADLIGWESLPKEVQQALAPHLDWEGIGQEQLDHGGYDAAYVGQTLYVWHES